MRKVFKVTATVDSDKSHFFEQVWHEGLSLSILPVVEGPIWLSLHIRILKTMFDSSFQEFWYIDISWLVFSGQVSHSQSVSASFTFSPRLSVHLSAALLLKASLAVDEALAKLCLGLALQNIDCFDKNSSRMTSQQNEPE